MFKSGKTGQYNLAGCEWIERNEKMTINKLKEELKKEIENKRVILNKMVLDDADKDIVLKYSKELDELIGKYHKLDLNIK